MLNTTCLTWKERLINNLSLMGMIIAGNSIPFKTRIYEYIISWITPMGLIVVREWYKLNGYSIPTVLTYGHEKLKPTGNPYRENDTFKNCSKLMSKSPPRSSGGYTQ